MTMKNRPSQPEEFDYYEFHLNQQQRMLSPQPRQTQNLPAVNKSLKHLQLQVDNDIEDRASEEENNPNINVEEINKKRSKSNALSMLQKTPDNYDHFQRALRKHFIQVKELESLKNKRSPSPPTHTVSHNNSQII